MWSTFHTIWPLPGSHVSRPIRASFFPLIKILPFKNKHYSSLFSEAETVFSSNFIRDHPVPVFVAPSRALFLAPLPLSPPSEQRSWIETCACWSSGVGGTAAGPRGWWPAGRGSSRSAASGWNRTAAPCSPLWPREVAISEVSDRRRGGREQGQKLAEAQRKRKAKKKTRCPEAGGLNSQISHFTAESSCFTELSHLGN